jgi:hypothetical protein
MTTTTEMTVPPLPRWKSKLFGTIMLIFVLSLLQFAAYGYLRLFHGYDGRHLMQYEFDPYKNVLPTRNYVDTRGIRHNSVGFRRSSEVSRQKPPGTYRIFLMGGSTAYGLGGLWPHIERTHAVIRNDSTIDAFLERELTRRYAGAKFEVVNAAITSTWTHHSLIYLNQTILNYDPDMVLFLDGFNDFYFWERNHEQFASYSYDLTSRTVEGDPSLYSLAYMTGFWAYRKFALVHVLAMALREVKLLVRAHGSDRKPLDVDSMIAGLQDVFPRSAMKMHQRSGLILRSERVHAVFMQQPMLILERERSGATAIERRLFEFNVDSYRPNYEAFMRRAAPWVAVQESLMASRVGAEYINLTPVFRDVQGQVYTDYCHLTPHGNEVVAATIASRVDPLIAADLLARTRREASPRADRNP